MEFYLLDVKRNVKVNGVDVAFDYINTYYYPNEAIKEAMVLSLDEDTLDVSVHKWILKEDGTQEHSDDIDNIMYHFQNTNHRH